MGNDAATVGGVRSAAPGRPTADGRRSRREWRPRVTSEVGDRCTRDGADAALDDGDAAVPADGAEPLPDATTTTPALEVPGGELAALVREKVPGPVAPEKALQKPGDCRGGRLAAEDGEAHDASRAVIDDNREPPAEGPHLRQGEGPPRGPETKGCGH